MVVSEAQAVSGELIDLKKVRSNRLKRPSGASMPRLDADGGDSAQPLDDLQWPVASLNKAIREVEDRITKELRDGVTIHDRSPILRDLKTEVTQVRSRLDELNERIERLSAAPAPRRDHDEPLPAPMDTDIAALEIFLADLAGEIDSAIAHGAASAGVVAPADALNIVEERQSRTIAAFTCEDATLARNAEAIYSQPIYTEGDTALRSAVQSSTLSDVRPRADYGRATWSASNRLRSDAARWVRRILIEAARRTKRRGATETKPMRRPLWGGDASRELSHGQIGNRSGTGLPSFRRASLFGLAGLILVLCGYALSRPPDTRPGSASSALPASDPASAGAGRIGVGVGRANSARSAMPSPFAAGDVLNPQMAGGATVQSALSLIPPAADQAAATRDPGAWAPPSKSAPGADPNMSESEVQTLAAQGDPRAQYELATRLLMRQEKGPDAKVAAGWLEKAANQGFALAQLRLGILYGKGVGVTRDYAMARKWFQAAAENGNAHAMHDLAVLISEGHGRKPDPAAAHAWFRKAAELGVLDSQYNLGLDFLQGVGVEKDLVQSYAWFSTAAAAGDAKAGKKRKEIASLLDPEELESARALADRLKRKQAATQAED